MQLEEGCAFGRDDLFDFVEFVLAAGVLFAVGRRLVAGGASAALAFQAGSTVDQQIIEEAEQRFLEMLQDAQMAANAMLMEYHAQAQRGQ